VQLTNLREVRRDRGLSQSELGKRVGVSQGRIASIEGGTSIGEANAKKLAKALLCDVHDLMHPDEPVLQIRLSDVPPELRSHLIKQ
jgi:transcriptional regulator with XRE-family HTH domain